jgi:hypothetical protein
MSTAKLREYGVGRAVLAHAKRAGLLEVAIAKVKAREPQVSRRASAIALKRVEVAGLALLKAARRF